MDGTADLTGVEPITDEQTWVEAATRVLADAPAAEPIARLLAESLWPSVAPLVTRAEDAERRIQDAARSDALAPILALADKWEATDHIVAAAFAAEVRRAAGVVPDNPEQ